MHSDKRGEARELILKTLTDNLVEQLATRLARLVSDDARGHSDVAQILGVSVPHLERLLIGDSDSWAIYLGRPLTGLRGSDVKNLVSQEDLDTFADRVRTLCAALASRAFPGAWFDETEPELHRLLESLRKEMDAQNAAVAQIAATLEESTGADASEVESLRKKVSELQQSMAASRDTATELTAPVYLPRRENMGIQLVSVHSLDRLEEYRSDANLLFGVTGIWLGALIGVAVNLLTGGEWSTATGVFVALVIASVIVCGWQTCVVMGRARGLRKELEQEAGWGKPSYGLRKMSFDELIREVYYDDLGPAQDDAQEGGT